MDENTLHFNTDLTEYVTEDQIGWVFESQGTTLGAIESRNAKLRMSNSRGTILGKNSKLVVSW